MDSSSFPIRYYKLQKRNCNLKYYQSQERENMSTDHWQKISRMSKSQSDQLGIFDQYWNTFPCTHSNLKLKIKLVFFSFKVKGLGLRWHFWSKKDYLVKIIGFQLIIFDWSIQNLIKIYIIPPLSEYFLIIPLSRNFWNSISLFVHFDKTFRTATIILIISLETCWKQLTFFDRRSVWFRKLKVLGLCKKE